jgi:acetylornithine deacetylase/succinyl-diaminopimelate desuccinylase-like protein
MTALPSRALDPTTWDRAGHELVATLRDLIRIRSINPPPPDAPDGELQAARFIADSLADAGIQAEIIEPVDGRGSVIAGLRGDGTGGPPLLLLGHLDVVPAAAEGWTHDPFAADVAGGYIWGRGAVDMKNLVAMELEVLRLLSAETRAAGRDPASDPVPGLTRDIRFAVTADEEAGGLAGIHWLVEDRPESLRAAAAINESGAVATTIGGRRFYPIGVAEKGYAVYRIAVHGTWGHGAMPRDDNAAVRAAHVVARLNVQGPPRVTATMRRFLTEMADQLDGDIARLLRSLAADDPRLGEVAAAAMCDPMSARLVRALLRDTVSPNIIHAGVKYNVIPGEAVVEVDCRVLPGTSEEEMAAMVVERLGPELAASCDVELVIFGAPVDSPADGPLWDVMTDTIRDHDPDGLPLPIMVPFATDAKHTARLAIPTYGFSPLRLDPDERFLERFHGVDERVSVDALRWGLPVLYDVVRRFCSGPRSTD